MVYIKFWLLNFIKWSAGFLICMIIAFITFSDYGTKNPYSSKIKGFWERVYIVCIEAPILETFIFFWLPFCIIRSIYTLQNKKLNIQNKWIQMGYIIITSCIFGYNHPFGYNYMFIAFCMGLMFSFFYLEAYKKKMYPFWGVVFIHGLHNFIAGLIRQIVT